MKYATIRNALLPRNYRTILSGLLSRDYATCKFCGYKGVDVSKTVKWPKCKECNEYHKRYCSCIRKRNQLPDSLNKSPCPVRTSTNKEAPLAAAKVPFGKAVE